MIQAFAALNAAELPYCIAELSLNYSYQRRPEERTTVRGHEDAFDFLLPFFGEQVETRELFYVIFLNQANHVVAVSCIGAGGITGTVADVRMILSMSLYIMANQIIIAHNHPSGNLQASMADKELTKKIAEAAKWMDIRLLDHLIISKHKYLSLADEGLLT